MLQESVPAAYPTSGGGAHGHQLSEEEQVRMAKRLGLIQHLPTGTYDGCKKNRECVICMVEFLVGDQVRYLPCMHTYHVEVNIRYSIITNLIKDQHVSIDSF